MGQRGFLAVLASAAIMVGCQSNGSAGSGPALLMSDDAANMDALKSGLAVAVGRANVELGAGTPMVDGAVSVLPPPVTAPEDRSLAVPIMFDLEMREGTCHAVRRDTGAVFELAGVECRLKEEG